MCDPITAITVASGAAGFLGQRQAASAQEAANTQARNLTIQNQNLQIRSLQNAEDEERRRASESLIENSRAGEAARATASVAASEGGVSGLSIDALLGDLGFQQTENRNDILQTQNFGQDQRQLDREGLGITAQSQINQLPLVEFPSFFDFGVQTGGAAVSTRQQVLARQASQPST